MIFKVTTILVSTFFITLIMLNFNFFITETKDRFSNITLSSALDLLEIFKLDKSESALKLLPLSEINTYSMPIVPEIKDNPRIQTSITNTIQVQNIQTTVKPLPTPRLTNSLFLGIPALKISAPIIIEPNTTQNVIYKQLEKGVVHYGTTPLPGEFGTAIILGHSSSPNFYKGSYGTIFSSLSKLSEGDKITITRDGKIYDFKVTKKLVFSPTSENDFELRELEYTTTQSIVLMTCWPVGTNYKRIAIRADIIQ